MTSANSANQSVTVPAMVFLLSSRRSVFLRSSVYQGAIVTACFITTLLFLQTKIQNDPDEMSMMAFGVDSTPPPIKWSLPIVLNSSSTAGNESVEHCPLISPLLNGWTNISGVVSRLLEQSDLQLGSNMKKVGLEFGGHYSPRDCRSRHKVAIIIPFRNRKEHLAVFLSYMHFFLQRQQLDYTIFVIEQTKGLPFNRGMMNNIGFVEAEKTGPFDCFFFHDVDLLPEDDRNLYACPPDGQARLMSSSIDVYDYNPTPIGHFGGVVVLSTNDFKRVNGYSNKFWGWGNEDDDLYRRVLLNNITVTRPFEDKPSLANRGRYIMLGHPEDTPNPVKQPLLDYGHLRMKTDGLVDLSYSRKKLKKKLLYTFVLVGVKQA